MTTRKSVYYGTARAGLKAETDIYRNALHYLLDGSSKIVSGDQLAAELLRELGEYSDTRIEDEIRSLAKSAVAKRWPEVWLY